MRNHVRDKAVSEPLRLVGSARPEAPRAMEAVSAPPGYFCVGDPRASEFARACTLTFNPGFPATFWGTASHARLACVRRAPIEGSIPPHISAPLARMLAQFRPQGAFLPGGYAFGLSQVKELWGGKPVLYPTVLLSCATRGLATDRKRVYDVAACGWVIHRDPWLARLRASYAFLESQYRIAARLGSHLIEITLEDDGLDVEARRRVDALRGLGSLRAFAKIEPGRGYFCLAALGPGDSRDRGIGLGCAWRLSPRRALSRALESLWTEVHGAPTAPPTGFECEPFASQTNARRSFGPARAGIEPTESETGLLLPCWDRAWESALRLRDFLGLPAIATEDPYAPLRGRSRSTLIAEQYAGERLVVRVTDPDFYHFSQSGTCSNFDNGFARQWALQAARTLARSRCEGSWRSPGPHYERCQAGG
ncbi:MAG: hypothetical protein ABSF50_11285 [Burkholderiaceae bacterium]